MSSSPRGGLSDLDLSCAHLRVAVRADTAILDYQTAVSPPSSAAARRRRGREERVVVTASRTTTRCRWGIASDCRRPPSPPLQVPAFRPASWSGRLPPTLAEGVARALVARDPVAFSASCPNAALSALTVARRAPGMLVAQCSAVLAPAADAFLGSIFWCPLRSFRESTMWTVHIGNPGSMDLADRLHARHPSI